MSALGPECGHACVCAPCQSPGPEVAAVRGHPRLPLHGRSPGKGTLSISLHFACQKAPCLTHTVCLRARYVGTKWFQYEITLGAYCFEWWEKAFIHLCVLAVLGLFAYGAWRQLRAMAATACWLRDTYFSRCCAVLSPATTATPTIPTSYTNIVCKQPQCAH